MPLLIRRREFSTSRARRSFLREGGQRTKVYALLTPLDFSLGLHHHPSSHFAFAADTLVAKWNEWRRSIVLGSLLHKSRESTHDTRLVTMLHWRMLRKVHQSRKGRNDGIRGSRARTMSIAYKERSSKIQIILLQRQIHKYGSTYSDVSHGAKGIQRLRVDGVTSSEEGVAASLLPMDGVAFGVCAPFPFISTT